MSDPYKGTELLFCDIIGEPEVYFAWWPRKCFDGRWVWMRPVWARMVVLKQYIDGPSDPWWQYARVNTHLKAR